MKKKIAKMLAEYLTEKGAKGIKSYEVNDLLDNVTLIYFYDEDSLVETVEQSIPFSEVLQMATTHHDMLKRAKKHTTFNH